MKNMLIFFLLLIFLVTIIKSGLTNEERKKFLKKYSKSITLTDTNDFYPLNKLYPNPDEITYDPVKVKEIIDKYNFPQNYNFIEAENAKVYVKDQNECGSCWAFATTTALSYRFHKKGIEVNLSPQHLISCYIRDCLKGDYLINTQFNLVKNGTVTEECLPYTSGDGVTIEECPTKCKNGSELIKYYSKNAYTINFDLSQEKYYDIVTLIMDQLINYGPVVSEIDYYEDFDLLKNAKDCSNIIYRYDGNSELLGAHAIVIVGYGYQDSKYYWLIQNSWGEEFCNGGFAKIEFAQVFVEDITFVEPYIPDNSTVKEISIKLNIDADCRLKFNTDSIDDENSFELYFKNDNSSESNFYYQCGLISIQNKTESICSYSINSFYNYKGYYKYREYQSLLKSNKFNIDLSSISGNQFYYYGGDYIGSMFDNNFYVSEVGSKLTFYFVPLSEDDRLVSKIYINTNSQTYFSDCNAINIEDYSLILCSIKQNELDYIESSNDKNLPIVYDVLCGDKEETSMIVHILDKTKYPVFRINKMVLPQGENLTYECEFTLIANIEGSISGYLNNNNTFGTIINIEYNNENIVYLLECVLKKPSTIQNNFEIPCYYLGDTSKYNNIKLIPYAFIWNTSDPFEVIIENDIIPIEFENYNSPSKLRSSDSHFIHISILSFCNFLLFLLY